MVEFICAAIIIALVACWVILFMRKIGLIEWVQVHSKIKLIADLFSCNFCLCWWICVIIAIFFAITLKEPVLLLCPFCSTPVARFLYIG